MAEESKSAVEERLERIERLIERQQGFGVYLAIERLLDTAIAYLNEKIVVSQLKRKRPSFEMPGSLVKRETI